MFRLSLKRDGKANYNCKNNFKDKDYCNLMLLAPNVICVSLANTILVS